MPLLRKHILQRRPHVIRIVHDKNPPALSGQRARHIVEDAVCLALV